MQSVRLFAIAVMASLCAVSAASAFTITERGANGDAANFSDPEDNTPFPHLSDNGQVESGQSGGAGFRFSGNANGNGSGGDAFARAQQRMQQ